MIDNTSVCPVCGAKQKDNSMSCFSCGFEEAHCVLFSGEKAYNAWKNLVDEQKKKNIESMLVNSRNIGSKLFISKRGICFFDANKSRAIIVDYSTRKMQVIDDVKKISHSGLHSVWIKNDGHLDSSGDNESNQRRLSGIDNAIDIATSPCCTYVLTSSGRIISRGSTTLGCQVDNWTDVKSICCAEEHIFGIKNDNSVVFAASEKSELSKYASVINQWKDVKKIATNDFYAVALCHNGSVLYAGDCEYKSTCKSWSDIIDIVANKEYVVGLAKDGKVLLAGDVNFAGFLSRIIDKGRIEASKWENMIFIASDDFFIAGISKCGELKVAGNINSNFKDVHGEFMKAILGN